MKKSLPLYIIFFLACFSIQALAYTEFYEYSKKVSGRPINCALCHTHGDGPDGFEHGQISALNKEEMEKLSRARSAFEPGQKIKSPILNDFGNQIIYLIGKKKFVSLISHPQDLPKELGFESDIDNDGIPDGQEYLDGTLATNPEDGHPVRLFVSNFKKHTTPIILAILSVGLMFWGFVEMLRGIQKETLSKEKK